MKKYLKYLGYGFLTLIMYCPINLFMGIFTIVLYDTFHDEIYGTFETLRDPSVLIKIFVLICVLYILILLGFFLIGRLFNFSNGKIFYALILFMIPNIALQILIYYSYSIELMCLLNWFLAPLGDVFFFETPTAYDLRYSFWENSFLTYLPFILAFLGGVTKKRKRQRKAQQEKIADVSES